MSAADPHKVETIDWYVEPDHRVAPARTAFALSRRRAEQHANSLALAITTALLFVLVASAFMFGGRIAIMPLLRDSATAPEADRTGEIIHAMPDGSFCRRLAFNNLTDEVTSTAVEPCPASIGGAGGPSSGKFEWGRR